MELPLETKQSKSGEDKWEGQSLETQSDPLIDTKQAGSLVLRFFKFQANPESIKRDKPTKQQLFDAHLPQIKMMLWGDGLEIFHGIEPKLIVSDTKDQYQICVSCIARKGIAMNDTPLTLKQVIHG